MIRRRLLKLLCLCFLLLPFTVFAQLQKIKGKVTDTQGIPLAEVLVTVDGTDSTTTTDRLGNYELNSTNHNLVFMLDGYKSQTVSAGLAKEVKLIAVLNDEVQLLYGSTPRFRNLQSLSQTGMAELVKAPVNNIRNALAGRLTGLSVTNDDGNAIFDGANFSMRGTTPNIMVDGVFRDYLSMAPEEIESITVLKDALSLALLGQRGANGVVAVKTRTGKIGKLEISLKAQTGSQSPIRLQKPLQAAQWATLFNEASVNDGGVPAYTDADIKAYQTGSDPLGHPNVDWFNTILEPRSMYSRYNLYASGASRTAHYFTSIDYLSNDGLLRTDANNPYNTNTNFNRVAIRSNVESDLSKSLTVHMGIFARIQNGNEPGTSTNNIFNALYTTPNNAYPQFARGDSLGTNADYQNNIWGISTRSGYSQRYNRDLSFDVSLRKDMSAVLRGLWLKAAGTYNTSLSEVTSRTKTYASYQRLVNATTGVVSYQQYGANGALGNPSSFTQSGSRNTYFEFSGGYDHSWGQHNLQAFVIANTQSVINGYTNLPFTYSLAGARAAYSYKNRYLAEVAASYSGHNMFNPGHQYGFFPSVGLGWVISEEDFFKGSGTKNQLKLRASYGKNGNINIGYYTYNQYYTNGDNYTLGSGATAVSSVVVNGLANPNLTWEKAEKLNIGLDGTLFANHLTFALDYYNNLFYDLVQQRGRNTALLGDTYPNENIGRRRYTGYELELGWNNKVGEFNYNISGNVAIQKSKVLYFDEVNQPYPWMNRTGQVVGQSFGYLANGLFATDAEAAAGPSTEGYTARAGDIRYVDLNKDGVINFLDQTGLLSNKPTVIFGLNLGFAYKGFDVSALFQGMVNRVANISGNTTFAFANNGKGQAWDIDLNRWTPATAATATYPRLSLSNSAHNQAYSSYWIRKSDFVRLKNAEIGYTVPTHLTQKLKLTAIRVFVNGQNLLTATPLDYFDPEGTNAIYPLQKIINAGFNIKF